MKKKFLILLMMTIITSGAALADGMVFDPTEYQVNPETNEISTPKFPANATIESNIKESSSYAQDSVSGQSSNFNNALFELDNAQVNIRNELLEYKAKYQEIDTQYKLIKEQRRVLDQQIKSVEKRIKSIERSKNQIRKTMI